MRDVGESGKAWRCRPSPTQELLLKASLLRGEESARAWDAWISQVDIDVLDGGSIRLLPLLSVSLKSQGIDTPELPRFKGVYRHTWCKNQLLVRDMTPVLRALEEAGIPTLLLKGAALIQEYYPDYGLRPMGDFDLLVPVNDAWRSMELLRASGWLLAYGEDIYRQERVSEDREQAFLSPTKQRLDLHWHAMNSFFDKEGAQKTDAMLWEGARTAHFQGMKTAVPNPADLLLHLCIHGSEGRPGGPLLRWVADSYTLLNKPGLTLDWDRLVQQAREHQMALPLYDTLGYLADALSAPIPEVVLRELKAIPASRTHQVLYALWAIPESKRAAFIPPASPQESLTYHWNRYRQWRKASPNRTLFHYLQEVWELESPGQVPAAIWRRGVTKMVSILTAARNRRSVLRPSALTTKRNPET
ncbi:MAG: nucleotidyltransferase family protein [Armatimonadota bacterium]